MKAKIKPAKKIKKEVSEYPLLKCKNEPSPWGMSGFYDGYRLTFSPKADAHSFRFWVWKKFLPKNLAPTSQKITSELDIYQLLSDSAKDAWANAYAICRARNGDELAVEDIFLSLLKTTSVKKLLGRLRVNGDEAAHLVKNYLKLAPPLCGSVVKKIPFEAFALSVKLHNHKVGSLMLLAALLKATPHENILQAIFTNIGLTVAKLELLTVWILDINYEFPEGSTSEKLLYVLRQAERLEEHFEYFFDLPAIEQAYNLSRRQTLKDLEHKHALQVLVKSCMRAKKEGRKIITAKLVREANT